MREGLMERDRAAEIEVEAAAKQSVMSGSQSLESLRWALSEIVGDQATSQWIKEIGASVSSITDAQNRVEQEATEKRLNIICDKYVRAGLPRPNFVVHNGSSRSPVAMLHSGFPITRLNTCSTNSSLR